MCHLCLAKCVRVCVCECIFTRGESSFVLPRTDCVIRFDVRSQDTEEKINSSQACPQLTPLSPGESISFIVKRREFTFLFLFLVKSIFNQVTPFEIQILQGRPHQLGSNILKVHKVLDKYREEEVLGTDR